ncbi:hypothetical protein ACFSM7_08825 [Clavibacter michiganensis subsp. tessellarius]|uniref:hypothetical protein n=1 Tax=Clavibacter tessellarius TaxID=31965 RepID=UPI003645E199
MWTPPTASAAVLHPVHAGGWATALGRRAPPRPAHPSGAPLPRILRRRSFRA